MDFIHVEKRGSVWDVQLNRPQVHNAFHPQLIQELTDLFLEVKQDNELCMVKLSGRGSSFCAGADLAWMKSMADYSLDDNLRDSYKLFEMFWEMATCPVPLLAYAHGSVFGGALGLLAVCDIVGAEEETRFCLSEVKLGLVPAVISPFVNLKVLPGKVREWMLTARVFGTKEAQRSGLVQLRGNADEVQRGLLSVEKNILSNGPQAVRATKALLLEVQGVLRLEAYKGQVAQVIAERRVSPEGQEGLKSFFEKRKPHWQKESS